MGRTLVALYQDTATAHHVVASLLEAGFSIDDVSLLVKDDSAFYGKSGVHNGEFALLGALVGVAVSIGTAFVPGIGPILGQDALGILATAGVGAAAGALTGGISAELIAPLHPEGVEVEADEPALRQSGTIVSLTTNDQWLEWAERIMGRYHPLKIEEREASWYGSSLGKFDLEHASNRAMKIIQDRSSATMKQIKSGTTLQKRARSYKYPN